MENVLTASTLSRVCIISMPWLLHSLQETPQCRQISSCSSQRHSTMLLGQLHQYHHAAYWYCFLCTVCFSDSRNSFTIINQLNKVCNLWWIFLNKCHPGGNLLLDCHGPVSKVMFLLAYFCMLMSCSHTTKQGLGIHLPWRCTGLL